MKKILIINQHTSNHGDEAAGKSLINELIRNNINPKNISIFYNEFDLYENEKIYPEKIKEHLSSKRLGFKDKIILLLTFIFPFSYAKKLIKMSSSLNYEYEIIKNNDIIINAPGGVNIGPYKDWRYLWRLFIALNLKKPVFIYSISFGPIPSNYLFTKISKYVLENVKFLSLRDKQSQRFADKMNLKYTPSIDTVFLKNLTKKNLKDFNLKKYIVFVPNDLYKWHPEFKNVNKEIMDNLYLSILEFFISKGYEVVMLPQRFGHKQKKDIEYFSFLKEKSNFKDKIFLIDPNYSVEYQLSIIDNSQFVIGARYHSIVFAIFNNKPFLSLSYESKMKNMLEILNLEHLNIDLKEILKENKNIVPFLEDFINGLDKLNINFARKKAFDIARSSFSEFYKKFQETVMNKCKK